MAVYSIRLFTRTEWSVSPGWVWPPSWTPKFDLNRQLFLTPTSPHLISSQLSNSTQNSNKKKGKNNKRRMWSDWPCLDLVSNQRRLMLCIEMRGISPIQIGRQSKPAFAFFYPSILFENIYSQSLHSLRSLHVNWAINYYHFIQFIIKSNSLYGSWSIIIDLTPNLFDFFFLIPMKLVVLVWFD